MFLEFLTCLIVGFPVFNCLLILVNDLADAFVYALSDLLVEIFIVLVESF